MDLKTLISKTTIGPELIRVRSNMNRKNRETAKDEFKSVLTSCCLVFVDDQMVTTIDLRRRLLDILHMKNLTELGQEIRIDYWRSLHRIIHGDVQILIAVDGFSK